MAPAQQTDGPGMRFLFGDRELVLADLSLLAAQVEVIVNPTDKTLSSEGDLAGQIHRQGGQLIQQQTTQLLREYGTIDTGMAVFTAAGQLPYKAIIHAVFPAPSEPDARRRLEQALSRSLQICDMNEWQSVAIPLAVSEVSEIQAVAQAYFRAITRFWDARHECVLGKVLICLQPEQFRPFFDAFREQGFSEDQPGPASADAGASEPVGEIELRESELRDQDNSDIEDWFK